MSRARCARCGREDSGYAIERAAPYLPLQDPPEPPWASIDGDDVCPECQTTEERRDAAQRVVAAIELEIERRRSAGIAPDPYEAALIAYAMASRGASEEGAGERDVMGVGGAKDRPYEHDVPPNPNASPQPTDRSDDVRFCVAVTGAFLTGHPLAVPLDQYAEVQQALSRKLKSPQWRTADLFEEGGTFESGGGFSEPVPLVIARRDGLDLLPYLSAALDDCQESGHLHQPIPGVSAAPRKLTIDIYDFGMAVLTAWLDVLATATVDPATVAGELKKAVRLRADDRAPPALARELQRIARDVAEQYGEAVVAEAPTKLQASWLKRSDAAWPPDDRGRLLWLHPVHVMRTQNPTKRAALALAPAFHGCIELAGGVFAPGIGWSAIVVSNDSHAADAPIRLTEVHWAYYALFMEIDRGLLGVLNEQRSRDRASLRELERDAEDVFVDYLQVMDARARLDSALDALGGDEFEIWEGIAKVQRFDVLLAAVERKLDALQTLAERRVEQAIAHRARITTNALGYLGVLGLVSLAIAIVGAVFGSVTGTGSVALRIAVVVGAAVLSGFLFWALFVWTVRAKAPYARC